MKRLEKIFNDITIQLKEEKTKYGKLKICKFANIVSKLVKYVSCHYQQDYHLLIFLLSFL